MNAITNSVALDLSNEVTNTVASDKVVNEALDLEQRMKRIEAAIESRVAAAVAEKIAAAEAAASEKAAAAEAAAEKAAAAEAAAAEKDTEIAELKALLAKEREKNKKVSN